MSCTKSNSVGSVCTYQCATGLTLSGSSQRVCQEVSGNAAQWTGTQPTCTDDHAPTITNCPSSFVAHQTETWGVEVTFTIPTATDTFDQTLQTWTVPADLTSPYIFTADTTCEYHFRDDAGNTASCIFDVSIHVIRCSSPSSPQHCTMSCTKSNSVGSVCTYQCATGLTLSGSSQRVCQEVSGNAAQWTGTQPACTDDHAPTISQCPSSLVAHRTEYWGVEVTFSIPTATDNFDQTLQTWTVPADLTSPYNFTADTICEFHFQDDAGNAASCTFDVEIHDTVVPEFLTCPLDQSLRTSLDMTPVTWDEPTYREIHGDEVRLVCNYGSNSVLLPWGNNNVIYTATNMKNGLSGICDFYVNIEPMPCLKLRTPGHGAISCDTWAYGRYCSMSCNDNYDIPAPSPFQPATDVFTCGSSGQWNPTSYVPDCSQMRDPTKINLPTDLLYYSGQCGSPATLSDIAQSFIETIEKSVHSDICKMNEDCTVDNVVITCGWPTRRRRKRALVGRRLRHSAKDSPQVEDIEKTTDDIEESIFEGLQEMRISMKLGVGVSKVNDIKVAQKKLQDLAREVLNITVSGDSGRFSFFMEPHSEGEDAPDAYLLINEHYIDCPDGYVAGRNNTKCVSCTTGHHYDTESRACHQCGYGLYQDEYGQVSCKSCDTGQSTKHKGSPSKSDCEDQCEAGRFSTSGLSPCIQCPLHTFQSLIGQTMCFECPDGRKTWNRGASDVEQCVHI
eukprot:XP_787294.3 PREDICTED: sushi, von Willebrand factor type A, EGF and pentraxin domain-containing protein 1 [Strongylocentrotus purpuratus]